MAVRDDAWLAILETADRLRGFAIEDVRITCDYEVSRDVVYQVLRRLRDEGLVTMRDRGTYYFTSEGLELLASISEGRRRE